MNSKAKQEILDKFEDGEYPEGWLVQALLDWMGDEAAERFAARVKFLQGEDEE